MLKIFYKFWPILVPFILYFLWRKIFRKRRIKKGKKMPKWEGKFFLMTVVSTFLIAISILIIMVFTTESNTGKYYPAQYIDGKIIPARVDAKD